MHYKKNSLASEIEEMNIALATRYEDDSGDVNIIDERVKSAHIIRQKHDSMELDDRSRSAARAKISAMFDYKPPHDVKKFKNAGRAGQFNVNFGEGNEILHNSIAPYLDIFNNSETLITLPLKREAMGDDEDNTSSQMISEEFTKMVRRWDKSQFIYLQLVHEFIAFGVGVGLTLDKTSWHFEAAGLSNFYFPPRCKAITSEVEFCTYVRFFNPSQLEGFIKNKNFAEASGWNVAEVERVLSRCSNSKFYDNQNPEQNQEQEKSHEIDSYNDHNTIEVIYCWCKEADGKVSKYITTKEHYGSKEDNMDACDYKEFLFRSHKCYSSMNEALNIFAYYTGVKGNIHTIRGLGSNIFPHIQTKNLMQCAALDSARDSMSIKYKVNADRNLSDAPIIYQGNNTLISKHVDMASTQHTSDLQKSAIPVIGLISDQISKMSASTAIRSNLSPSKERRSALEVGSALEYHSSINASSMNLFIKSLNSLLVQMAKRAFRKAQDLESESGKAAKKMQEKLLSMGVTQFELDNIDYDEALVAMPLGMGNASARNAKLQEGMQLLSEMDDVGRKRFYLDRAVSIFGPDQASRYFNKNNTERPPIDKKIAELENNQLLQGFDVQIDSTENFIVHLRSHVSVLSQLTQSYEKGELPIEEVFMKGLKLFEHSNKTIEMAIVPESELPELNFLKQALQQIGEVMSNGQKAVQKASREQALNQNAGNQSPDSEEMKKMKELEQQSIKHRQELQFKEQEFQQKLIHNDQEHAAKMRRLANDKESKFQINDTPAERV